MTSGFATVAGTVMGAYISFGASASHLICASIMSAPAALAMAKLSYPETKKSRTTFKVIDVCVYGFCSMCFYFSCKCAMNTGPASFPSF